LLRWPSLEALQKQTPHQLRKFFYAHNCRGESTMLERLELVQQAQALTQDSAVICKSLHKRRNWIHIGSEQAGPRVAAILSVVETCRRLKIPVRDYLGSVLPGLGDFPAGRIAELTPTAWANRN
jgi:hypothetical protein